VRRARHAWSPPGGHGDEDAATITALVPPTPAQQHGPYPDDILAARVNAAGGDDTNSDDHDPDCDHPASGEGSSSTPPPPTATTSTTTTSPGSPGGPTETGEHRCALAAVC
jgi:hypothetical protein